MSQRPLAHDSQTIIASIGADKPLDFNLDMNFVLVPPNQPRVPVKITLYPGESDLGRFRFQTSCRLKIGPSTAMKTLAHYRVLDRPWTTSNGAEPGDRHGIVVDPVNGMLYEFYQARKTSSGWEAAQASVFDLKSTRMRPEGWTSADAAGLPVFPAVVRYDECKRGMVSHALRVTVRKTRRAYVYPARHFASSREDANLPRMGERLRLRRDFDISSFPPHAQAILKGLKKHGMFVADNGKDWLISVAPDRRLEGLETLNRVKGSDFEVVVPSTPAP